MARGKRHKGGLKHHIAKHRKAKAVKKAGHKRGRKRAKK